MILLTITVFKTKESLNGDDQQFHKYQQNKKESLNGDDQQFHKYQQNKRKFKQ
jgi:hypothetical protein